MRASPLMHVRHSESQDHSPCTDPLPFMVLSNSIVRTSRPAIWSTERLEDWQSRAVAPTSLASPRVSGRGRGEAAGAGAGRAGPEVPKRLRGRHAKRSEACRVRGQRLPVDVCPSPSPSPRLRPMDPAQVAVRDLACGGSTDRSHRDLTMAWNKCRRSSVS